MKRFKTSMITKTPECFLYDETEINGKTKFQNNYQRQKKRGERQVMMKKMDHLCIDAYYIYEPMRRNLPGIRGGYSRIESGRTGSPDPCRYEHGTETGPDDDHRFPFGCSKHGKLGRNRTVLQGIA